MLSSMRQPSQTFTSKLLKLTQAVNIATQLLKTFKDILYLGSNIPFSSLENGRHVYLIVTCCIFTGTVAKNKQLINIRMQKEKMFTKKRNATKEAWE